MWGRVAQKSIYAFTGYFENKPCAFTNYFGRKSCAYSQGRKNAYIREVHEN